MFDYKKSKGFESLMLGVKLGMNEDYIIDCLNHIELEKLKKDLEKSNKEIQKIEEKYFKKNNFEN